MFKFGETNKYELKERFNETLVKEVEAFLNTAGGVIFIGINTKGDIVGIPGGKLDEIMRKVSDVITDQILPRCIDFVETHCENIDGKDIIQIDIRKGDQLFYIKKYGMSPKGCHIRIGSSCKELSIEEIKKRFLSTLKVDKPTIYEMKSFNQRLTFKVFKIYLEEQRVFYDKNMFEETFCLLNVDGYYNEMAYLLSDQFDESIKICRFKGDGGNLVMRKEFGNGCIFKIYNDIINYMQSQENIVRTFFDHGQRRDEYLYDEIAFVEAWKNAVLHNDYSERQYPQIYLYDDRLEVLSHGNPLKNDTFDEFVRGVSKPINLQLSKIAINLNITDQTGKGNKDIVRAYGKEVFDILDNTLIVKIPYNNLVIKEDKNEDKNEAKKLDRTKNEAKKSDGTKNEVKKSNGTKNEAKKSNGTKNEDRNEDKKINETKNDAIKLEDEIIELIKIDGKTTMRQMVKKIGISKGSIERCISKSSKIKYIGPKKGGHWEVYD